MRTYQAEKDAGIDHKSGEDGRSSAFVTAQVQLGDVEQYFKDMSVADLIKNAAASVQSVEELLGKEQFDLALVVSILVSTGWNLNDDVFVPAEVWKARSSPVHKPMNDQHDATKILGHIVQSKAIDKSGDEISIGEGDDLPADFDLEVAGVLYRQFPDLRDRINEIIEKAQAGDIFVSMEAWFPDFDYGLIDSATGETKLISRNENTAFLTKHLRAYGGTGQYQEYRVGRVLKDFVFGAQGFVDTPANPESVIRVAANRKAASQVFVTAELKDLLEGGVEDVDEKQMEELQAKLDEVTAKLNEKEQEVAELKKTVQDFEEKDYDGQVATLTANVTETSEKIEAVEAEKVELQTKLDEAVKRAETSEAELSEIRKTEVARERLAKLAAVRSIEDEDATLAALRDMEDSEFESVMKFAGEAKVEKEVVEDKTEATESDQAEKAEQTTEDDEAEAAEAALDNVDEDGGPEFNASEDVEKSEAGQWVGMAHALCGKKNETDEGGE